MMSEKSTDNKTPFQPYAPMRALHPDLYVVDGEWYDSPFRRRMTVVRLGTGELAIHSAIRLKEEDYWALERLGRIRWVLVPNFLHSSEAHFYTERYAEASLDPYPDFVRKELDLIRLKGLRFKEVVYYHRLSRTLIVCDMMFNVSLPKSRLGAFLYRFNYLGSGPKPSRTFRWLGTRSKKELGESVRQILDWDFDRIIMNHGEIVETGGREIFRQAFEWTQ